MPEDKKSLLEFSDDEFLEEAKVWATLAHGAAGFGASYRVGRLLSMLEKTQQDMRVTSKRREQLESMLEELFNAFMLEQSKMKVLQHECDEWRRQASDVAIFVNDENVTQLEEGELEEAEAGLARELGVARAGILDALASFRRIAPESMLEQLGRDIRRVLP